MNRKEFIENVYYIIGLKKLADEGPLSYTIEYNSRVRYEINALADKLGVKDDK